MKKIEFLTKTFVMMMAVTAVACSDADKSGSAQAGVAKSGNDSIAATTSINIRYIDEDSVTANYNLAKDFREAAIRDYSKLESEQQRHAGQIQALASQIDEKMRSNGYLSEASYNADMAKLNKMQQDAQNAIATLQRKTDMEMAQRQAQLHDSIESFIKAYNADKGYDAILLKAAGVYFNPALDITADVIKGLNERYNKVDESK